MPGQADYRVTRLLTGFARSLARLIASGRNLRVDRGKPTQALMRMLADKSLTI